MADVRPIDGAKLYEFIEKAAKYIPRDNDAGWYTKGALEMVMGWVKEAPTLDYDQAVRAHWNVRQCDDYKAFDDCDYELSCSNCNHRMASESKEIDWLYCPYCGAKMDEAIAGGDSV